MRKGELTTAPLLPVLRSLAGDAVTGCLHVVDPDDREARVYLRSGCIYSVTVPGRWRRLGARLVSSGELAPDALAEALEVQRTELQGWRLGELLVYLGFIDQDVIERIVGEQLRDAVWDLLGWQSGTWRFRPEEATRDELVPPTSIADLVASLQQRSATWSDICTVVPGPWVVPMLATRGGAAEMALDADAWSLLCKVDGRRTVGELAYECGHTLFEAGQVLLRLMEAGLVEFADGRPREEDTDFGTSLARVSQALADVLGPAPDTSPDPYAVPAELRHQPAPVTAVPDDGDWRRQQQIRAAAAAELAAAHAMAEAMHHQALEEAAAQRVEPEEQLAPVLALVPEQTWEPVADEAPEQTWEPVADEAPETLPAEAVAELPEDPAPDVATFTDETGGKETDTQGALLADVAEVPQDDIASPSALAEFAALAALDEPIVPKHPQEAEPEAILEIDEADEPQLSAEDIRRRAEQQRAAAALLSELAAHEPADEPVPVSESPAPSEPEPAAAPAGDPAPGWPAVDREHTDTAALLRELSSLGLDEEPAPSPAPARLAPPQRTATSTDRKTKKRGFFGL